MTRDVAILELLKQGMADRSGSDAAIEDRRPESAEVVAMPGERMNRRSHWDQIIAKAEEKGRQHITDSRTALSD